MRAQFTPLGAILIVAMIVSLISIAYIWSDSMIDTQKAYVDFVYAKNKQMEIRDAIDVVSGGEGRQELVTVDLDRIWLELNEGDPYKGTINSFTIESNSLDLIADSSERVLLDDWTDIDPDDEISPVGKLGEDSHGLIIGRTEGDKDRIRLWYRDLYDGESYYRVELKRSSPWNIQSDRTTLILTNTGERASNGNRITQITVSVK